MSCGRKTRLLLASSLVLAMASVSQAALIFNHGTYSGSTVDFVDVTEDTGDTILHYGSFGTVGDTLTFDPLNFEVQDNDLMSSDLLDSELQMMIVAHDDSAINTISFSEGGDYTIITEGTATASLPYFWEILAVDGNALTTVVKGSGTSSAVFTVNPGEVFENGAWNLDFTIDLDAELAAYEAANGVDLGNYVTKVGLTFDNTLAADGLNGGSAFIKKKTFSGMSVTTSVPEPASLGGLLLGMFAMCGARRRR